MPENEKVKIHWDMKIQTDIKIMDHFRLDIVVEKESGYCNIILWSDIWNVSYIDRVEQTPLKSWLFQASIRNCLNCIHNCDDHSSLVVIYCVIHFWQQCCWERDRKGVQISRSEIGIEENQELQWSDGDCYSNRGFGATISKIVKKTNIIVIGTLEPSKRLASQEPLPFWDKHWSYKVQCRLWQ